MIRVHGKNPNSLIHLGIEGLGDPHHVKNHEINKTNRNFTEGKGNSEWLVENISYKYQQNPRDQLQKWEL